MDKSKDSVSKDPEEYELTFGQKVRNGAQTWAPALRMTILLMISTVAVLIRVFSVIRYESVIHEFDPWFNYRTTQFMVNNPEGLYGLWNWFDAESWYPLGRAVGGTVYPGLMATSATIYWTLHKLSIPMDIRNVCVFLAPVFAAFTAIASYALTCQCTKRKEAGLLSALFISIVPSYMSRSVAGSYDNEAVAIFALVFSFYTWLKAVNTGSILNGTISALALFYMIASWGGYAFIINIIPIFVVFTLLTGRYHTKVYVAYCTWYIVGTVTAMQIPFVGFQAIHSSEHLASHGVFIVLQGIGFFSFIRQFIDKQSFVYLSKTIAFFVSLFVALIFIYLIISGQSKWSGRSMTLLDPTYAKKYIPIIASVSEHQATTWSSFFFDLHFLMVFSIIGLYVCFKTQKPSWGKIFVGIYLILAVYFASVMVRLLLVLAPVTCIAAGLGVSFVVRLFTKSIRVFFIGEDPEFVKKKKSKARVPCEIALLGLVLIGYFSFIFILHSHFTGAEAYSSPSIILSNRDRMGNRHIVDDFREAYYWIRMNTKQDAKILSWWDYGYQITGMSNRTVMVDNNTWNNTHIATVGMAMASEEAESFEIQDKLDVDYVLVIFGGFSYYSGDDINKFLWMVRIGGGVFPHIKEEDYYGKGQYRIDAGASDTMLNSLMYSLSFYRFDEVQTAYSRPKGFDTVRNTDMGRKNIQLEYFDEVFTSENWLVRLYKRKDRKNREGMTYVSKNLKQFPDNEDKFMDENDVFERISAQDKILLKKKKKEWVDTASV